MSAILDFPPIVTDESKALAPSTAVAAVSLKAAALAHFSALEQPLRTLAEKYRAVAFDTLTTKGLDSAKKARNDLRENGRYAVQRAEKSVKDEVNDLKRVIAPKVESLIAIVKPVEDHVNAQIEARETQLAAERAERERIEAERKAKHEGGIATIRGYVTAARGKTSTQIEAGRCRVLAIMIGDEWEEYRPQAEAALRETLDALQAMRDAAKAAEDAAAADEAKRVEQARIDAEQKAEANRLADEEARIAAEAKAAMDKLAADQAELAKQKAEFEEQQRAALEASKPAPAPEPPAAEEKPASEPEIEPVAAIVQTPPPAGYVEPVTTLTSTEPVEAEATVVHEVRSTVEEDQQRLTEAASLATKCRGYYRRGVWMFSVSDLADLIDAARAA